MKLCSNTPVPPGGKRLLCRLTPRTPTPASPTPAVPLGGGPLGWGTRRCGAARPPAPTPGPAHPPCTPPVPGATPGAALAPHLTPALRPPPRCTGRLRKGSGEGPAGEPRYRRGWSRGQLPPAPPQSGRLLARGDAALRSAVPRLQLRLCICRGEGRPFGGLDRSGHAPGTRGFSCLGTEATRRRCPRERHLGPAPVPLRRPPHQAVHRSAALRVAVCSS